LKQKDENKTAQIFSATLKLVANMGVAGITMRQIASEAGIATGTLYIYFKDKEELVNKLYEDCRTSSVNAYLQGYDATKNFKTGFKLIWRNIFNYRIENFEASVFMEQCFHSPFITETTREMTRRVIQPLYKLMDRGKSELLIKDLDTKLLLIFMVGNINDLCKYAKYINKKISDDIIEDAFSVCWDGLKK
jgi:AcrR family transcriptional regulator